MPRPNRSVAGLCIAVIVLAAFLPGIFVLDLAVLEPHRVLLPDEICTLVCTALRPGDEQP